MNTRQVWFVTGASKGFGLEMTRQLLERGHRVAATSRNVHGLRAAVDSNAPEFLPLGVDLTDEASVGAGIRAAVERFGRLDVLVNNAGYSLLGGAEELSGDEVRDVFEVNVFGVMSVVRAALPQLREQGSGHVINFSSVGGINGAFPGWSAYCASKFAVEGAYRRPCP